MWSFAKLPPGPPPPVWHFFKKKNLPPFFLLKIASLMAETNFTLGPTSKTNKFPLLFLVIVGQNSQHKRANLNSRTPLDIYSNNRIFICATFPYLQCMGALYFVNYPCPDIQPNPIPPLAPQSQTCYFSQETQVSAFIYFSQEITGWSTYVTFGCPPRFVCQFGQSL